MATKPTNISRQMIGRHCFETGYFPFEKKTDPVRFEPTIFAVPGVFVTSRPSVPHTQRNLVSLRTEPKFTISNFDHSKINVIFG